MPRYQNDEICTRTPGNIEGIPKLIKQPEQWQAQAVSKLEAGLFPSGYPKMQRPGLVGLFDTLEVFVPAYPRGKV